MKDPYQVLGIDPNSNEDAVKKAYRDLAKKHHPDLNGGSKESEAKFKEINEAYERITNPEAFKQEQPNGFQGNPDIFNDFFENIFGGGGSRVPTGQNYTANINLTFEEACFGCSKTVEFDVQEICMPCKGLGATEGNYTACGQCGGAGRVIQRHGFMQVQIPCPVCAGRKVKVNTACGSCKGSGHVVNHKKHDINVPPLRNTGDVLKVRGGGEAFPEGAAGDLLIRVMVVPKPGFERNGVDIESELVLTLKEALLGADKSVETIHGVVAVKVPECSKYGQKLRVKGKGAKTPKGSDFGNHLLRITVNMPNNLTEEQKNTIERIL